MGTWRPVKCDDTQCTALVLRTLGAAVVVVATSLLAIPARALPVPPSGPPVPINLDVPMPADGVVFVTYEGGSYEPVSEQVDLLGPGGVVLTGTMELPHVAGVSLGVAQPQIYIWRPGALLSPGSEYTLRTYGQFTDELGPAVVLSTLSTPLVGGVPPEAFLATLHDAPLDTLPPDLCCAQDDDDREPSCFAQQLATVPELRVQVDPNNAHPLLRQILIRAALVPERGISTHYGDRTRQVLRHTFREQQTEYCFQLTLYDAISRTEQTLAVECLADDPLRWLRTSDKTNRDFLGGTLHPSRCHRPPPGYEAQYCEANASFCYRRDQPGCHNFDELCPGAPADPRTVDTGMSGGPNLGVDGGHLEQPPVGRAGAATDAGGDAGASARGMPPLGGCSPVPGRVPPVGPTNAWTWALLCVLCMHRRGWFRRKVFDSTGRPPPVPSPTPPEH